MRQQNERERSDSPNVSIVQRQIAGPSPGKQTLVEHAYPQTGIASVPRSGLETSGGEATADQIPGAVESRLRGGGDAPAHRDRIQALFGRHDDESLTPKVGQPQEVPPSVLGGDESRPGTDDLAAKLRVIAPDLTEAHARRLAPIIRSAFTTYHVSSPAQQAMFLAQSAHETGGWRTFTERLPRAHAAEGDAYFDRRYGGAHGRRLGNTDEHDGSSYRGRGALQITGRDVYTDLARRTHLDLVHHPELGGEESFAFIVSAAYWNTRTSVPRHWFADHRTGEDFSWVPEELCGQSLNEVAQAGTGVAYDVITFAINPHLPAANVAARHEWYLRAATAFGIGGDASSRVVAPAASGGGGSSRHGPRGRGTAPSDT